jgi:hypothetical protein
VWATSVANRWPPSLTAGVPKYFQVSERSLMNNHRAALDFCGYLTFVGTNLSQVPPFEFFEHSPGWYEFSEF